MAKIYSSVDIIDDSLTKTVVKACKFVSERHCELTAAYLIGSSVAKLISHDSFNSESSDVDIAVIPKFDFQRGSRIIDIDAAEKLAVELSSPSIRYSISHNGIPFNLQTQNCIDLIPIKPTDVASLFPQVKIDLLSRHSIHVFGENILQEMINPEITNLDIINRLKITEKYIDREYKSHENHFLNYIKKSFSFSTYLMLRKFEEFDELSFQEIEKTLENQPTQKRFSDCLCAAQSAYEEKSVQNLFMYFAEFNRIIRSQLTR